MIITKKEDIQIKSLAKITAWVNHHTDSDLKVQFDQVNKWHKDRKFTKSLMGYYGAYNFLIEKDGTIYQYRMIGEELMAHKGHNKTKGATCLTGAFRKDEKGKITRKPTKQQESSLIKLMSWLLEIKPLPMYYRHGDLSYNKTDCPILPQEYYTDIQTKASELVIKGLQKQVASKTQSMVK